MISNGNFPPFAMALAVDASRPAAAMRSLSVGRWTTCRRARPRPGGLQPTAVVGRSPSAAASAIATRRPARRAPGSRPVLDARSARSPGRRRTTRRTRRGGTRRPRARAGGSGACCRPCRTEPAIDRGAARRGADRPAVVARRRRRARQGGRRRPACRRLGAVLLIGRRPGLVDRRRCAATTGASGRRRLDDEAEKALEDSLPLSRAGTATARERGRRCTIAAHARPTALLPDHRDRLRQQRPGLHTLYEVIGADVIARWHRMLGDDTRFLTGTDEHSVNIAQQRGRRGPAAARVRGREGRAVQGRRGRAPIAPDRFIRTTDPDHIRAAQEMVRRAYANGDIYLGTYEGWYCPNEGFKAPSDLPRDARAGCSCPNHPTSRSSG